MTTAAPELAPAPWSREDEDAMILTCLPLVRPAAWKVFSRLPGHAVDLDELVSIANAGLVQAARAFGEYCERNTYDPRANGGSYQRAYALRRINGSLLDALRHLDHASRSNRARVKALDEAGGSAEAAGMTEQQARTARAAVAARPRSIDADMAAGGDACSSVADPSPLPESEAVARSILRAAAEAFDSLHPLAQVLVAYVHHQGRELAEAATLTGLDLAEAGQHYEDGVLAIHAAMLRAAT